MAEFNTNQLKLGISSSPETTYNTTNTTSFLGLLTTGRIVALPDREKFDDRGTVGAGQEHPTVQLTGYVVPPSLEIATNLNTEIAALLLRRALGGVDTVVAGTVAAAGTHTHTFRMANTRQLPSSTMVVQLQDGVTRTADYIWSGMLGDTIRIDQSGVGVPTFSGTLIGSGKHERVTGGTAVVVPAPTTHNYFIGAETRVSFTEDVDGTPIQRVISETGVARRLLNFSTTISNSHRSDDRRAGNSRVDSTNPRGGHYVDSMPRGDRDVAAEMTVVLDENLSEIIAANNDNEITNFTYEARGRFIGTTTIQRTFRITFPRSNFRAIRGSDEGGIAAATIGIFPLYDPTDGMIKIDIINEVATPIV